MAITQVGTATTDNSEGTGTITITKPTGVASGDLLLFLSSQNNQTPNLASGWTMQGEQNADTNAFRISMAYKVAGGSEPSNYTFTLGDTSVGPPFVGTILAFRGVKVTGGSFGGFTSDAVVASGSEPEPTGTVTNTAANGRAFYSRHCRWASASGGIITYSATGVTELADDGSVSSSGNTSYSHGIWMANADFSGGGNPSSINTTASPASNESDNLFFVWTLESLATPATGTFAGTLGALSAAFTVTANHDAVLGVTLPALTAAVAADVHTDATLAATLPPLTGVFGVLVGDNEGELSATLPTLAGLFSGGQESSAALAGSMSALTADFAGTHVGGSFSATLSPLSAALAGEIVFGSFSATLPSLTTTGFTGEIVFGSFSATLSPLSAAFLVETRPFGPNVISVEFENRRVYVSETDSDTGRFVGGG